MNITNKNNPLALAHAVEKKMISYFIINMQCTEVLGSSYHSMEFNGGFWAEQQQQQQGAV